MVQVSTTILSLELHRDVINASESMKHLVFVVVFIMPDVFCLLVLEVGCIVIGGIKLENEDLQG